jgi:hypothetical protein
VANRPPTVSSTSAAPNLLFTGQTSTVTVYASDADNDPLTCTWSATGGTLSSTTGCPSVTWTAPNTPGQRYWVSVSVTDNYPGHSPVVGSDDIYVQENFLPTITSLTANPETVTPGWLSTVTVVASDRNGDPLTCTWSATGGTLSSTTGCGSVTWTAPAAVGTYTVSVSVTDNFPGHSPVSRSVSIVVNQVPVPTLISPAEGAVLDNMCPYVETDWTIWDFDWSDVAGATQYHLYVIGPPPATNPRIDIYLTASAYHFQSNAGWISDNLRLGWRWKVRAMVGGVWGPWAERSFDVELGITDCP